MQAIYFDMDGTIADLYSVNNWHYKITHNDATPYKQAKPLVNVAQLQKIIQAFKALGITVGVISWGAKGASAQFTREVKKRKQEWCNSLGLEFEEFHVVKYGTPKYRVAKIKNSILVDDSQEVREKWHGETIDASQPHHLLSILRDLLQNLTD